MGAWPRYVFALGIGIILSAVFVYTGGAAALARLFTPTPTTSSTREKELTYIKKSQNPLLNRYRPDERLNGLVRALRKGDLKSLQVLRPEFFTAYGEEELRGKVIPTLRSVALESLLSRLTEEDREEWQQRALNPATPSPARLYVDDVTLVNESLGTFLEGAAELLQLLRRSTKAGKTFATSAEAGLGITPLTEQQQKVFSQPLFREVFERERAREVRRYMTIRPTEVKANLALLASVDPNFAYAEFYQALEGFLAALAQRVSANLRLEVLSDSTTRKILQPYQEHNQAIREASARIYNLAALDAISLGELDKAGELLHLSELLRPGFGEQQSARDLLERVREKRLRAQQEAQRSATANALDKSEASEDALGIVLEDGIEASSAFAAADQAKAEGDDEFEIAPLFMIILTAGTLMGLVVAVLVWRKQRLRHLDALAAHRLNASLNMPPLQADISSFKKIENQ